MRVAVVGGGVYGCTAAVELARAGHTVELFERHRGLLYGATRANQGRLHHGYHYPRSLPTAQACKRDAARFAARFPAAIDRSARHYYAIAARDSLTNSAEYLEFLDAAGLDYNVTHSPLLQGVDLCVRVPEAFINLGKLREQLRRELRSVGVTVRLGVEFGGPDALGHDMVVMATYGQPFPGVQLRYEVCEVALVEFASRVQYPGRSFVVMDGPFVSVDPIPVAGMRMHTVYDVDRSVHHASVGAVEVPDHLAPLLDRGPVFTEHSRADAMLAGARRFLDHLGMPTPWGSMFTVRAVLPDVDASDERPTLVRFDGGRTVWVLSGKIDGAVTAAERVAQVVADWAGVPA